jgi:bifunctional NMN adenylyltransferase/nudix hydrolase
MSKYVKGVTKYVKVFIGRFQPFHLGHLKVLRAAIDTSDHVVVVIGSASNIRTPKNPWGYNERVTMIAGALTPAERKKVSITGVCDHPGEDDKWVKDVKTQVQAIAKRQLGTGPRRIYTLIGCHKGAETYYLKLYKGWNLDLISQNEAMNATDVRKLYFDRENWYRHYTDPAPAWADLVPGSSYAYMDLWSVAYHDLYTALCKIANPKETGRG